MSVDPAQLQLLALIEQHGSLSAVARALGLTPAAVLHRVVAAEQDCGVPLVIRSPRGATPTRAGALLAAYGRDIQKVSAAAASDLARIRGELSLRLRIGSFQAAAIHLLPPALTALRHRCPEADVSVVDVASEEAVERVGDGCLDVALVASWGGPLAPPPQVRAHSLLIDPMVVVLPDDHPLVARQPPDAELRLEQLRTDPWVSLAVGRAAREQFDHAAVTAGFTPKVRFETESYDVAQALVGTGIGVALVSRLALTHVPGTTHRELAPPRPYRHIHAVTRTDSDLTPLVGPLLDFLRDVARDITATWGESRLPADGTDGTE
ncbi:LysR family transcriptional regulator [Streptomyces sparsogenes]|uniref:LysR family transcriptional regulator n=1 Tax=Streptomyces sparsogenes TaxID=67365 RepID=UPI003333E759